MSGGGELASANGDATAVCRQCGTAYHKAKAKFCSRCGTSRDVAGSSGNGVSKRRANQGPATSAMPSLFPSTKAEARGPVATLGDGGKATLRPFEVEQLRQRPKDEPPAHALDSPLEFRDPGAVASLTSPKRHLPSSIHGVAPPAISSSSAAATSLAASRSTEPRRERRKSSIYAKDSTLPELPPASLADPRRFAQQHSEPEEALETKLASTSVDAFSGASARAPVPALEQQQLQDSGGGGSGSGHRRRPSSATPLSTHARKRAGKSRKQRSAVEDTAAFADGVVAAPVHISKENGEKQQGAAEELEGDRETTGSILQPSAEEEAQYSAWATLPPEGLTPEMLQTSNASELRKWRKGSLIGRGTYGSVYLGLLPDGSFYAVKSVELGNKRAAADHLNVLELVSLTREINMMRRLRHRNLCTFKGVYYDAENMAICMFMEYIGGGSLSSLVKRFKPLPPSVVRNWTKQLLTGLQYLHTQHIIHRDIKGDNVLVDTSADPSTSSQIKLVDFGAARRLTDAMSQSSTVIGTPYWMAPEVVDASGDSGGYSYKADVWSVGCTVAEMLTGRPPWPCKTSAPAAIMMIASATGMPTEIPEEEATPGCLDFMRKCFIRDPTKRPTVQMLLQHPWIQGKMD
ncbi:putative NPK1-related protein kinase [Leptomonas seymouri]|uniref:Putative NPK1-related protein kinase n=1 Tax=Leptomonas seymouri TaxID=5684 RepID=A0A0N1HTF0_LEPSE|nr:putative NPK1-related protein kinase [Leptomonas seymouri]|eukprot:KPI84252.1 putative NPK1-related protein kinase [Leptomonas seymouri]